MKYFSFLFLFFSSLVLFGQAKPTSPKSVIKDTNQYNLEKGIYKNALKYNDFTVAKNSVFKMMALNPSDKTLRDTLLFLYFNAGSYAQSVLLSREILAESSSNTTVLLIKAMSEQNLGLIKESLEDYEKLYPQTKELFQLYQIAVLQYQLRRFGECSTSIAEILKSEKSATEKVSINLDQNQSQEVILKAAALNIRGVMYLEEKRDEEAKADFTQALVIQPDFELAKNNLALTMKKLAPASSKPAPKKPTGK
jgi:tetratricopeptide (TPR) repeat protein